MDYYWSCEDSDKLRKLINAESIERGEFSLSLVVTYMQNEKAYTSEPICIKVDDFTKHFASTMHRCIPNISTASAIKAVIIKKHIVSGNEEFIHISNPPFTTGKKI